MAPHLMQILPHMWNTLTQSADRYVRTVVNYTDDADDPVDSDGKLILPLIEQKQSRWKKNSLCNITSYYYHHFFFSRISGEVLGFENLVFSVFEFIHGLIETPKFKKTVKKFLDELIYFLVLYMQITEEQVGFVFRCFFFFSAYYLSCILHSHFHQPVAFRYLAHWPNNKFFRCYFTYRFKCGHLILINLLKMRTMIHFRFLFALRLKMFSW